MLTDTVTPAVQTTPSNTDLYGNLRARMSTNRTDIKQTNDRIVDFQSTLNTITSSLSTLSAQMDIVQNRLSNLESAEPIDPTDTVQNVLQNYSDSSLQPLLQELVSDIEALTVDVKLLKNQNSFVSVRSAPDTDLADTVSTSSLVNKTVKASVKPLNITRSASTTRGSRF